MDCFTDIYNTPTYAVNLAEMIEAIIKKKLSGIWHTVGVQRVNRCDLFRESLSVLLPLKIPQFFHLKDYQNCPLILLCLWCDC